MLEAGERSRGKHDVRARVASQAQDRGFEAVECDVALLERPPRATVTCVAQVRPLFAPVLPGMERIETVRAAETAVARSG